MVLIFFAGGTENREAMPLRCSGAIDSRQVCDGCNEGRWIHRLRDMKLEPRSQRSLDVVGGCIPGDGNGRDTTELVVDGPNLSDQLITVLCGHAEV